LKREKLRFRGTIGDDNIKSSFIIVFSDGIKLPETLPEDPIPPEELTPDI